MGTRGPKPGKPHAGQFKPGVSGNPGGAPKLPDDLKLLQNATTLQAKRDLLECYNTKLSTLRALSRREDDVSGGLAMIASCVVTCADNGDVKILAMFLERLLGKPKEVDDSDDSQKPDQSKDQLINDLVTMLKDRK